MKAKPFSSVSNSQHSYCNKNSLLKFPFTVTHTGNSKHFIFSTRILFQFIIRQKYIDCLFCWLWLLFGKIAKPETLTYFHLMSFLLHFIFNAEWVLFYGRIPGIFLLSLLQKTCNLPSEKSMKSTYYKATAKLHMTSFMFSWCNTSWAVKILLMKNWLCRSSFLLCFYTERS